MQKPTRNFGLDVVRAIAIILVVISHCTYITNPDTSNAIIEGIRVFGAIGVDIFFVLSGFLIGGILLKYIQQGKLKIGYLFHFWKRRWLRTLPNYALILVLNVLLLIIFNEELVKGTYLYAIFLQNFNQPHPNFFTEAWSLSIEEYAYVILPLLAFLVLGVLKPKDKEKAFFLISLFTIIFLIIPKYAYYIKEEISSYQEWSASFRKVVLYRLDSIYIGFLLVFAVNRMKRFFTKNKNILFVLAVLVFLGVHVFIYIQSALPQTHIEFYTFLYLQLIILSVALSFPYMLELKGTNFIKKIATFISIHSYAIYLINYSMVLLTIKRFINFEILNSIEKVMVILLFLSITIVLSRCLYKYIELPVLKYRDKIFPKVL